MTKQLPVWIIDGQCFKPESVMCNLGYACDGCPYITDRKLLEIHKTELTEMKKEVQKSIIKYIAYTKKHNIEIPKEFDNWNLVEKSLYIFKNHNKIKKEI